MFVLFLKGFKIPFQKKALENKEEKGKKIEKRDKTLPLGRRPASPLSRPITFPFPRSPAAEPRPSNKPGCARPPLPSSTADGWVPLSSLTGSTGPRGSDPRLLPHVSGGDSLPQSIQSRKARDFLLVVPTDAL